MPFELKYGDGGVLEIDLPAASILGDFSSPRGTPLDDPAAAVAAAVSDPLEFPRLQDATIPGDRVVLAIDRGVPRMPAVVAGVIHALVEGGADPADIGIVLAVGKDEESEDPAADFTETVRDAITVTRHDAIDRETLSYLAASRDGKPIYFNRQIGEADVVIPISTLRLDESLGYAGIHSGLFPAFADEETQKRFRAPSSADWTAHRRRRHEEADEAAWLLGVQFTIQVAPGPGNTLLHVLAGDAQAVAKRGQKLCEAAWRFQSNRRASLVVATIEGGREHQTWENLGRALFAASQAVDDGGAIVLCTNLDYKPGPAIQRLTSLRDSDALLHELRRDRSSDATSAALLAEVRERVQVYLLSGLDAEFVEDLGVGCVSGSEEVTRLTQQHDSCILLGNAHHAVLAAVGE